MSSPHDESPTHDGWEVEYRPSMVSSDRPMACKTPHPGARSYELISDRNEAAPTLVLYDENEEAIALYNGSAWSACRRIARPGESL